MEKKGNGFALRKAGKRYEEIKEERREKENMRRYFTWIGMAVCMVSLLAGTAGATVPFADDIPDTRLNVLGTGSPTTLTPAFDLDDYVIDNDNSDDAISWGVSVEAGGPVVNIAGGSQPSLHEADVLGVATAGVYEATYTATDPDTQSGSDTAVHKYSSFWLSEPTLTTDNRLSVQNSVRFTYVKLFDGTGVAENTGSLLPFVESGSPVTVNFGPLLAYALDSGTPVKVGQGNSLTLGGLAASVQVGTGNVFLTPSSALTPSCALLLSIPAVLQGSSFDDAGDWDGAVIMVAPAKAHEVRGGAPAGFTGALDQECRFENIPVAALVQPGAGTYTGALPVIITGSWRVNSTPLTPTSGSVSILNAAQVAALDIGNPANQFAGATSGNVLCLEMDSTDSISLESYNITPVQPGEVYGISFSMATDIPSGNQSFRDAVRTKLAVNTQPDNGIIASNAGLNSSVALRSGDVWPTDSKWRTIYTEIRIPSLNQAIDGSLNLMDRGIRINVRVSNQVAVPSAYNVYIDNIYVYCKGQSDLNVFDANGAAGGLPELGLANGVTAYSKIVNGQDPTTNGDEIDGTFESGTDIDSNNFAKNIPGLCDLCGTLVDGTDITWGISAFGLNNSNGSLYVSFPTSTVSRVGNYATSIRTLAISNDGLDTSDVPIADAPDNIGEGYYGATFWVYSDAASIAENIRVKATLQERRPTLNQVINGCLIGPSAIPVAGQGWYQYSLTGAFPNAGIGAAAKQFLFNIQYSANATFVGSGTVDPYTGNNSPGAIGNAQINVDNIVLHKVSNNKAYWNASLFQ